MRVRKRIIELSQQHKPTTEIAELFGFCRSDRRRIRQILREHHTLTPRRGAPGRKLKLVPELQLKLQEHVAAHPDATRQKCQDALQLDVSLQTISR